MDGITQLGCIVCILTGRGPTPAEVHHMLRGGRRMGHLFTIPLCVPHHRGGRDDEEITSRDQCQRRFEKRYGSEDYLLAKTRELIARLKQLGGVDIDAIHYKLGAVAQSVERGGSLRVGDSATGAGSIPAGSSNLEEEVRRG
jgi:hypothetical protein